MPIDRTATLNLGPTGRWFAIPEGICPAHDHYPIPSRSALGLEDAEQAAHNLEFFGRTLLANLRVFDDQADFEHTFGRGPSRDRWLEVGELYRAAGERFGLALAGVSEVSGMLEGADPDTTWTVPLRASFLCEASLQLLVSAGHALTNAGFRLALENRSNAAALAAASSKKLRQAAAVAAPGSIAPAAWLFHSDVDALTGALSHSRTPAALHLRVLRRLQGSADWVTAHRRRNVSFHRWEAGYSSADEDSLGLANESLAAAVAAAGALGRATPSLIVYLLSAVPHAKHGPARGAPLAGMALNAERNPVVKQTRFWR